jgi:hypothetical protein
MDSGLNKRSGKDEPSNSTDTAKGGATLLPLTLQLESVGWLLPDKMVSRSQGDSGFRT